MMANLNSATATIKGDFNLKHLKFQTFSNLKLVSEIVSESRESQWTVLSIMEPFYRKPPAFFRELAPLKEFKALF